MITFSPNKEVLVIQRQRMSAAVEAFKKQFFEEFDVSVTVYFSDKEYHGKALSLTEVELVATEFINGDIDLLRIKSRKDIYTEPRQVFFKVCIDMGYGFTELSRHFGFNHATILHANRKVNTLISINDFRTVKLYNEITNAIKERIESKGTNESVGIFKDIPKSGISPMLYPGIHQSLTNKLTPGIAHPAVRQLDK
jgi:hypothetical protein